MGTKNRIKNWFAVGVLVTLIYSTLSVVRPAMTFLKSIMPIALLINGLFAVLLVSVFIFIMKIKNGIRALEGVLLAWVAAGYLYAFMTVPHVEEKLHLIEYGVLAWLIFRAVRVDCFGRAAYIFTFVLTSLLGWIDEGIQYLLPDRYFQWEDVLLNSASSVLALILIFVLERKESPKRFVKV